MRYWRYLDHLKRAYPPEFSDLAWLISDTLGTDASEPRLSRMESLFHGFGLERFARPRRPTHAPPSTTDVLLVFQPDRHDYLALFTPVLAELRRRGVSVSVMLPPGSRLTSQAVEGFPTFTQLDCASFPAYLRARRAYWRLAGHVARLATWLGLDIGRTKALRLLLQNYCWSREIVRSALMACMPKAVLGLHFMSTPGILGGINLYRKALGQVPVFLQQHGLFSHEWATHDFHGADCVLLWGEASGRELRRFPGDIPLATVVGNPKLGLQLSRERQPSTSAKANRVLVVGTNGDSARERAALLLVTSSLGDMSNLDVVYRPHPSQPPAVYDEMIRSGRIDRAQVQPGGDVYDAVRAAQVVLGTESTVLQESVLLGVPAIQLLSQESSMSWTTGGMLDASDSAALRSLVAGLVEDPDLRAASLEAELPLARDLLGDPEGAATRIADVIQAAVDDAWNQRQMSQPSESPAVRNYLTDSSVTPLVTVMIPTYNQASLLDQAIRSALEQDFVSLEVLVIDDASTDSTPTTVAQYQDDPRFVYERHDRNLGRVATYRDGLYRLARGSFVLNLDGDDWLSDRSYISAAMSLFELHQDLALVFARSATYDESTKSYVESELNRGLPSVVEGRSLLHGYASDSAGIPHLTALYRKDLARQVGFYEVDVIGADSISFLKLFPGRRVGFIDEAVAVWRKHGHNTSHAGSVAELLANFAVADVPAEYLATGGVLTAREAARWQRRMAASLGYRHVANFLGEGQYREAAAFIWAMAKSRPLAYGLTMAKLTGGLLRKLGGGPG